MTQIEAVYEAGIFRPLEPVQLPERTRVTVALPGPSVEQMPDEEVVALANGCLSATDQEALSDLLGRNCEGRITPAQRDRLDELTGIYRRGLVLKARATAEAVARGLASRLDSDAA